MTIEKVLTQLNSLMKDRENHVHRDDFDEVFEQDIEALKVAIQVLENQPKEKTGWWIDNTVTFYRECSECGALVRNRMEEIFLYLEDKKLNYCPNCGAKMEG